MWSITVNILCSSCSFDGKLKLRWMFRRGSLGGWHSEGSDFKQIVLSFYKYQRGNLKEGPIETLYEDIFYWTHWTRLQTNNRVLEDFNTGEESDLLSEAEWSCHWLEDSASPSHRLLYPSEMLVDAWAWYLSRAKYLNQSQPLCWKPSYNNRHDTILSCSRLWGIHTA